MLIHAYNIIESGCNALYLDIRGFISDFDDFMAEFYDNGLWGNDDRTTYGRYDKATDLPEDIFCTEKEIMAAARFMDSEYDYWDPEANFIMPVLAA